MIYWEQTISLDLSLLCRRVIDCSGEEARKAEKGLEEAACCPGERRPDLSQGDGQGLAGDGRAEGRGNAEGRRERVKAHVGFEKVSGEALVAVHQECSFSEMTSATGTSLRSHTAVRRQSWNMSPLLEQHPVQPSAQQAGQGLCLPSTAPTPSVQDSGGSCSRSLKPLRKTKASYSWPGNQRNHHLINQ